MNVDQSARRTARIPLRLQPMKNKRGGALWGPWVEWIWGFKKKTRVNSRGCGKSKWLLKVYLFSILFGKLTYQWHIRKCTQYSIRKVTLACCQLKLNVAAEAEQRMGSHASGLVLSSKSRAGLSFQERTKPEARLHSQHRVCRCAGVSAGVRRVLGG